MRPNLKDTSVEYEFYGVDHSSRPLSSKNTTRTLVLSRTTRTLVLSRTTRTLIFVQNHQEALRLCEPVETTTRMAESENVYKNFAAINLSVRASQGVRAGDGWCSESRDQIDGLLHRKTLKKIENKDKGLACFKV